MKIEYRFDIAAILLASVLTVLGFSAAQAGEKCCAGVSGGSGGRSAAASGPAQMGGKGGVNGGDVRSRAEGTVGLAAQAADGVTAGDEPNAAAWSPLLASGSAAGPQPKDTFTPYGGKAGGVVMKK